jgi:alpha-tubulin suppressor-like RCC1 family protein
MRTSYLAASRLCSVWCLVMASLLPLESRAAGGNGTLLILQNPTNSSPRIVSMWGGGGSEQIVMKSDGTVWDWGFNSSGQLGNGTTNNADLPVQVLGPGGVGLLAPVAAVQGGEQHNTALKANGTVWSWGNNKYGQLGDGSTNWGANTSWSTTPVQVQGLTNVKSLGGRGYHTLALKTDGTVWAWGRDEFGELGNGAVINTGYNGTNQGTNIPLQVIGLTNPASLSAGGFFSLALMSNGTVMAWGENDQGQCGNGSNATSCLVPTPVLGLTNVAAISGGWEATLALLSNGTVMSWGLNGNGELGDGTTNSRYSPVQVIGLSNIVSVWEGDQNSMALRADGTVWKWGENQFGEQGNGTFDDGTIAHPIAQPVPGLSNIVVAVCRDYHDICIQNNGGVWVWGDNRAGGCGDFTGNSVLSPRLMPGFVTNNTIPYADSFESYTGGASIVGTNFWSAPNPANAVVVATNYSYNSLYPIPGPHQYALGVNGIVTNQFCPSFYSNLWVDMILQANPPTNPLQALTNCSFAIAVAPDGHFAVWNCTNPPAAGNGWTELQDTPVATNQFCRVTIEPCYTPDANGIFYYSVWVNGVPSTNPAARYAAADSSQPWFGQIVASGNFILDDLVVGTNKSFYALQTSASAYGGSVSPSGPLIVVPGSTNTFLIAPSNWYTLASVTIDGTNAGTPASCTFANVQSDHTVVANYSPILAANNTPEWWLYQQNPNWATNFDAAALSDPTGKGVPVWQDYIAGTDPANPASLFALAMARQNGQATVSFPAIAAIAQYQMQRYYALDCTTNLADPSSWQVVPGWTKVQGLGQNLTYSNTTGNPNLFFRGRVWLGP